FSAAAGICTYLLSEHMGASMNDEGRNHVRRIIAERETVATAADHPVSERSHAMTVSMLTDAGSSFTSSLYRDVTAGLPSETEHILGDLALKAAVLGVSTPLLDLTLVQ